MKVRDENMTARPIESELSSKGITVHSQWLRNLVTFLIVLGPGLIVMTADNDAGAVSTYTQAGAFYGSKLLWLILLLLPTSYFIQEMVARLGIATGQGHAAMIYQRFGKWWGVFSLVDLLLVNFLTLMTEFAGIALVARQIGVSPYLMIPMAAGALVLLVATRSYLRWERVTIGLCILNVIWFPLAFMTHPPAAQTLHNLVFPTMPHGGITSSLIFMIIGVVGTTIAPWQLFFQQSCVADKRLRFDDLKFARLDTFVGVCVMCIAAACMMLVGASSAAHHLPYTDAARMAARLGHFYGPFFKNSVLILTVDACVLGATTISLSSAWAYGEVKGWSHSLQKSIKEAPGFYGVYAVCVAAAAALVLIPRAPLQLIIVSVQVLAGVMLPSAIIFLQLLLNDKQLLGEKFANRTWNNVINWTIIIVLFGLSLILAAQVIMPNLFPSAN